MLGDTMMQILLLVGKEDFSLLFHFSCRCSKYECHESKVNSWEIYVIQYLSGNVSFVSSQFGVCVFILAFTSCVVCVGMLAL